MSQPETVVPGAAPAIRVSELSHTFASGGRLQRILDHVDFAIEPGQSVALLGRSGSGKSTLLNLISGLEPISQGAIYISGQPIHGLNDHERTLLRARSIGFVHQSFNLIPTLSVSDNIVLPLALARNAISERTERLRDISARVGLCDKLDEAPDRLSGGEQQRVAIARALIHRPPVILADEPTGNLDASNGRRALDMLLEMVQEQRSALLLVTHSMEVARETDHVLVLDQATIRAVQPGEHDTALVW